jgi:pyruvate/2-oxoglutarate dehydrogenase complex dihydrolipoamide dehydrogenase (E3) component
MVASARVAYLARRSADYGVYTGEVTIDMRKVRERKRAIVESFRGGSEQRIRETAGVDLLMGEASFVDPHTLEVVIDNGERRRLSADLFVINTGARPAVPPIPGLESVPVLDSTSVMELDSVPEHLVVLGGGYIALEFGQMFRRFGSRVTILQRGPRCWRAKTTISPKRSPALCARTGSSCCSTRKPRAWRAARARFN